MTLKSTLWLLLRTFLIFLATLLSPVAGAKAKNHLIVLQTDFGLKDGAVSEIKGVIYSIHPQLVISDLTHEIPPYNIWEAAYRLYQTAPYWPKGTIFVSVVDPGVGTHRKSVVAKTASGHYFVTPDNGTLTLIDERLQVTQVREIDEKINRLPGSYSSHTFHGRDVFGYTAGQLAAGKISFEQVGRLSSTPLVKLPYAKAQQETDQAHRPLLQGTLVVLDPEYGNAWTNIGQNLIEQLKMKWGELYQVSIFENDVKKYEQTMTYQKTFGDVPKGTPLLYLNSLLNLSIGINQGNFARESLINTGSQWRVEIKKADH